MHRLWRSALIAAIALLLAPQPAAAQSRPEFIAFPGTSKAALYRPDAGPAPHVGILVMHRTSNFLAHRACTELSRRGFLLLCMNTRFENNEALVDFEKLPLDMKAGVDFLRAQPGISKVVLFGHSGGGPLMALYQAIAENGPSYCRGATSSSNAVMISPASFRPTALSSPTPIRETRSIPCAASIRPSPTKAIRPTRRSFPISTPSIRGTVSIRTDPRPIRPRSRRAISRRRPIA
jgi:hypothetical protein